MPRGGDRAGGGGVQAGDGLDALQPAQPGELGCLGGGSGVDPHMCAPGLREDALPGVGRVTEERRRQQEGGDDAGGGEDEEQRLAPMGPQVRVRPAQCGSHRSVLQLQHGGYPA